MYTTMQGQITNLVNNSITLTVNNIGYELFSPDVEQIKINQEKLFYVVDIIKDEKIFLYGFLSKEKQLLFCELIKVNGVGPKTALILLQTNAFDVMEAINKNDISFIISFSGIGLKTAQQIILELSNKLVINDKNECENFNLMRLALNELGYKNGDIIKLTNKINYNADVQIMVKEALKILKNG